MKDIIFKYLEDRASKEEQIKLLEWLRNEKNRLVFNSLKLDWKKNSNSQELPYGSEKTWLTIQDQLLQKSYNRWQHSLRTNLFLKVAAIFFFVISLGITTYFISVHSTSDTSLSTHIVAENGQISKVELPDGSKVWLNSGSEITFNNSFAIDNRAISLTGEAYFQVTKNINLPLLVKSEELYIKVLGTKFNVAAYPESNKIEVVLESGKVDLLNSIEESTLLSLRPGEMASYNKNEKNLKVQSVNTYKFTSWKDGVINIYNQPFEELVKRLEKRYNQRFAYSDDLKEFHFTFTIENEPLDEILGIMKKIAPIKIEQQDELIVFNLDKEKKKELSR